MRTLFSVQPLLRYLLAALVAICFALPAQAANVGYYNLTNPASNTQVPAITGAGNTPIALAGLTAADLAGLDVLWIINPNNNGYAAALTANVAAIFNFVNNGGTLMFHDRHVTTAATVIPGAGTITFVRQTGSDIDLGPDAPPQMTNGQGGTIDNTTLDGGTSSNHGHALAGTLPAGSKVIFTTANSTHAVDFAYPLGAGSVYYSSIPLDYYLAGNGPAVVSAALRNNYAVSNSSISGQIAQVLAFVVSIDEIAKYFRGEFDNDSSGLDSSGSLSVFTLAGLLLLSLRRRRMA